ncbi:hypothetical protein [Hydrogenophilus thiooxidans]|uniref:hypothetical protein n=1 Tax=Hydrogenophilus thiooxidans TaxID=2820326 RepID=UPI001C2219F4|nr:hypothetical protein [Hydrogenophilus thiooxidans]
MPLSHAERRRDRRIPVPGGGLKAHLITAHGERHEASCTELSVGGLTLRCNYVPALHEVLAVQVDQPPASPGVQVRPLRVRLEVRRCEALPVPEGERVHFRYELGGKILEVLS